MFDLFKEYTGKDLQGKSYGGFMDAAKDCTSKSLPAPAIKVLDEIFSAVNRT